MFKGLYNALPTQEEVLNRSTEIVSTTAERLRQAQAALTSVVAAVPEVVGDSVIQANRQLARQYPELRQGVNGFGGYQEELLEPHDFNYLRSLVLDCRIDAHYNWSGYNAFSCVASDVSNVIDQKKRIQFLFACRVNVNSPAQMHHNRTPLHLLIINKNEAVALFLIDYTRNSGHSIAFHLQDFYGNTTLLLAIKEEQVEVADAILDEMEKFGANIGLNLCDADGKSPLDYAFSMKIEKIIVKLITLGAEYHAVGNHHEIVAHQKDLLKPRNIMHVRDLVLEGKVNVHHDHFGFNALSGVASASMNLEDQKEGFKFLLQCRFNINSTSQLNHHRTPIHFLIIHKNESAVLFLIEHARERKCSIDFKRQDIDGNTVLVLAIKMMQPEVVFTILDQMKNFNADIGLDLWDVDGRTALDCAVILGQIKIIRALIALEAKPHAVANRFSNFATFDEKVIRSILESVNIDPDQVCEDKYGHKILLYQKCLKDKSNVPLIFWPRLYQGVLLSPLPPWRPYTYLPPLHPHIDLPTPEPTLEHKKPKP